MKGVSKRLRPGVICSWPAESAIYEAKTAMKELKKGGMKAVDEMKGQMKLGRTMMKKKRMHLNLDTIQNKPEVKALYRKAKQGKGV